MSAKLLDFVSSLSRVSKNSAVLVEGKRDREALDLLGVRNVFTIAGIRLTDLPDILEDYRNVVLLFDLDKHGEKLTQKVKAILIKEGYILIEEFRNRLKDLGIIHVEDLYEEVRGSK